MVRITFYQDGNSRLTGFDCRGHAGFQESGKDIVCAGISALVINCINSVEVLTDALFSAETDETDGMIRFRITSGADDKTELLLRSLLNGLTQMEEDYNRFLDVIIKEV